MTMPAAVDTARVCHLRRTETPEKALRRRVQLTLRDEFRHTLSALVHMGAEYNLCNPADLPTTLWEDADQPNTLLAANDSVVEGWRQVLHTTMELVGSTILGERQQEQAFPLSPTF